MLYPEPMYLAWGGAPAQNFVRTGLRKKKNNVHAAYETSTPVVYT